ncbi:unnamed protein product [Bathycoccus prasinos]
MICPVSSLSEGEKFFFKEPSSDSTSQGRIGENKKYSEVMKKQQSLLGKSNDSSYLAKRFATPVKVTSGIGLLAAGAIAVVGNGIDFPLPTYGY